MRPLKTWLLCLLLSFGAIGVPLALATDAPIGNTPTANAAAASIPGTNGSPIARDFPPGLVIPDAARPGPHFDADKATQAYLDLLSPEQRKLSDGYFEGGYWIQLWSFLYGLGTAALLLFSGFSTRARDFARGISPRPWLSTMVFGVIWLFADALLGLPWAYYTDFVREHSYGLSNQGVGDWLGDNFKAIGLTLLFVPPILALLLAMVRRMGARWWIYASACSFVLFLLLMMFESVFVEPIFNHYEPLPDGPVREAVLSLARANRIPTEHVEWFDASKQTTRVSANVSGFLGTTRVNLNDNLVNRTSMPEIKAVLGHEMGHYVLNHGLRLTIYLTLVTALGLFCVHRMLDASLAGWGRRLRLEGRDDPAALPLAMALLSIFFFVMTPVSNSIVRQAEAEADAFGLNAAREPNGFAMSAMRLSTYRKLRPGALEEMVFYDHPSGYTRVHNAMLWLAENQDNPTANAPVAPPMQPLPFASKTDAAKKRR